MEKKGRSLEKIQFRCLKEEDIPKCIELITETFALFDPFIVTINLSKEDLKAVVLEDLKKIINDNLVTICVDENSDIAGCYAGFKMNKIPELNSIKQRKKLISINKDKLVEKEQKLKVLELIDNNLIYDRFLIHKKNNELETSIFCDYFCVSSEYFQSNLANTLAMKFFENCKNQGINHIYGSFYNIKAIKLLTKNYPAEILDKVKVEFIDESNKEEKYEYEVILLYGNLSQMGFSKF